jgi:hypothetical protein
MHIFFVPLAAKVKAAELPAALVSLDPSLAVQPLSPSKVWRGCTIRWAL